MIVHGDLLKYKGLLVQQVNCRGVMGRGLAKAIREKWPQVYLAYKKAYDQGKWQLGMVQVVDVEAGVWVANLAGQLNWGTQKQQTNYMAYRTAWSKVYWWARKRQIDVYAPWFFGCGLAGGDWKIVQPMIEKLCPSVTWVINQKGQWEQAENFIDTWRKQ